MRRVLTAEILHETNTFSIVPTTLESFRRGRLIAANEIPAARRDLAGERRRCQ